MPLTYEQILPWIPDSVTLERGRQLRSPRQWQDLEGDNKGLWGNCKSSGVQTYQTTILFDGPAYHCSCRDKRSLCRHAVALLLLYIDRPEIFNPVPAPPPWVDDWRSGKTNVEVAVREPRSEQPSLVDEKRFRMMSDGVRELENWLTDLINQGLATVEKLPSEFWEDFAARMVDAKLSGIGRRIRQFDQLLLLNDWHEALLMELGELHLFVQAFRKLGELPESLQQEVLVVAGVNIKKDEVLARTGIKDRWLVIGQQSGEEEKLHFRRTWLLGEKSQQMALMLDFTWGRTPFPVEWMVGSVVEGEVVYYPAAYLSRALVKQFRLSTDPFNGLSGYDHLDKMIDAYTRAIAANPWLRVLPCFLESVVPVYNEGQFLLVDQHGKQLPFGGAARQNWKLIAISTGQPIHVFGEWNGRKLLLLSVVLGGRILSL